MGIPECKKCGASLGWGKLYKSSWKGYQNITCPNCQCEHEIATQSRGWVSILIVVPTVFSGMYIAEYLGSNMFQTFLLLTAIAFGVSLFIPYIVKYNKAK